LKGGLKALWRLHTKVLIFPLLSSFEDQPLCRGKTVEEGIVRIADL